MSNQQLVLESCWHCRVSVRLVLSSQALPRHPLFVLGLSSLVLPPPSTISTPRAGLLQAGLFWREMRHVESPFTLGPTCGCAALDLRGLPAFLPTYIHEEWPFSRCYGPAARCQVWFGFDMCCLYCTVLLRSVPWSQLPSQGLVSVALISQLMNWQPCYPIR